MNLPQAAAASETRALAERAAEALREAAALLRHAQVAAPPGLNLDIRAWLKANDKGGE